MAEFVNLSQALTHSMGRIEGAKEDITVGDYLDVIDSSWAIGRLFTQLKLYFNGKGWVNDEVAKGMIKQFDRETLASIQKICYDILDKLQNPKNDPVSESLGYRPSTEELQETALKAAPLGGHHIDRSIKSIIR